MDSFKYQNSILLNMPKNSAKGIEKDERKILDELKKNANKSINEIAEKCGFSRQKVWRVINNLEKNKTIWGYTVIVDEQKLNKKRYIMLIKRSNKPVPKEKLKDIIGSEIADKVKKIGVEFINSIYINGRYDWIISFTANSLKEAKSVVELYNELYEGLISEIHLNEEIFTVQNNGIRNPEIKKLKDFF